MGKNDTLFEMDALKAASNGITGSKIDAPVTSSQTIHPGCNHEPGSSPLEWKVGDLILDTYDVVQVFGSGGMAYVYRVHHRGWDLDLAVKSPRPEMLQIQGNAERFVKEAETWVNLGLYPHIVSCYYIRVLSGVPRIFMEYVDGGSLSEGIDKGRLYVGQPDAVLARMLDVAIQFAWGLHYAHEKGLVHQDVKPGNVLLTADGLAKVTDFGMAQARASLVSPGGTPLALPADSAGQTILVDTTGLTPAYCSPEQAAMRPLSRRTDVWSWAVSILEMFTGQKTWKGGPLAHKGLAAYLAEGPAKPGIPLMPAGLAELLMKCLEVDPDKRPRDMMALANSLIEVYRKTTGSAYGRSLPRMETRLADTLNNRGVSMLDLGRDSEGQQLFDAALKTDTTHPAAVYNLNLHLWRSGRATDLQVVSALQTCQKDNSASWEPAYLQGLIHLERGDPLSATGIARAASERFGESTALRILAETAAMGSPAMGECVASLEGCEGAVSAVDVSSEGNLVVGGSNDQLVRVWSLPSGQCVRALAGHDHLIRTVKFSPDGMFALSGSWDQTLRLWDLARGECAHVFEGHTGFIQEVAFTPDGRYALSTSSDCTLRLWDLDTGDTVAVLEGHTDTVWSVVVTRDGSTAVSTSYDNTIRTWDLHAHQQIGQIDWVRTCTSNLALSRSGKRLLLAAGDHRLWLIDLVTGSPIRSFVGHTGGVNAVKIAPNDQWAVSAGNDGTLRLWELNSGRCLRSFTGHSSAVQSAAVCQRKAMAVSGSSDRTIKVWRLAVGPKAPFITVLPRSSQEVIEISQRIETTLAEVDRSSARGDYAAAMALMVRARQQAEYQQHPTLLERWDQIGQKGTRSGFRGWWLMTSLEASQNGVNGLALLRSANQALIGGDKASLNVVDLESGGLVRNLIGENGNVQAVAAASHADRAVSGSEGGMLRVWRLDNGECLKTLAGHTSAVSCVAISPDGRLALSGSNDNSIRLWDLNQGKNLRVYKGHTHFVRGLAWAPDGRSFVSASWDRTLRLWDVDREESHATLSGHAEVIDFVSVAPDGMTAVSGGVDSYLRVWDLAASGAGRSVAGMNARIRAAVFSPDGRYLFTGEEDGWVRVWEVASWACRQSLAAHYHPVTGLAVSPDGRTLISASSDRSVKRWYLDWEYTFPTRPDAGRSLEAYLLAFLQQHRPYGHDGGQRGGRISWSRVDFEALIVDLGCRGYGGLAPREIERMLKALTKRGLQL